MTPTESLTPSTLRRVFGQFATGVTVVTAARVSGSVHGMTANSFTSVSLNPPLILICVAECAQLLPLVRQQQKFGVNILKAEQRAISEYFAQTEEDAAIETRLGIRYLWNERGVPLLEDALVHMTCSVVQEHVAGDHTIFVARVESAKFFGGEPLLFLRGEYREVLQ